MFGGNSIQAVLQKAPFLNHKKNAEDGTIADGYKDRNAPSARTLDDDMRYWWVNQNQTYRHEVSGGYLWSPKRNADGARNPFYESMREVAPGDLIFSFMDTRILAVGIVKSYA
jgi:hypothetical protein